MDRRCERCAEVVDHPGGPPGNQMWYTDGPCLELEPTCEMSPRAAAPRKRDDKMTMRLLAAMIVLGFLSLMGALTWGLHLATDVCQTPARYEYHCTGESYGR